MGSNYAEYALFTVRVSSSSLYCFVQNSLNTRYSMFAVAGLDWGKALYY